MFRMYIYIYIHINISVYTYKIHIFPSLNLSSITNPHIFHIRSTSFSMRNIHIDTNCPYYQCIFQIFPAINTFQTGPRASVHWGEVNRSSRPTRVKSQTCGEGWRSLQRIEGNFGENCEQIHHIGNKQTTKTKNLRKIKGKKQWRDMGNILEKRWTNWRPTSIG